MLSITLLTCLVSLSPVGPMPVAPPSGSGLQISTMIDVPDNARVRGPGDPAITVVGGTDSGGQAPAGYVEVGAFGSPIIARSDLVMRSFDKGVNFTVIKYPHGFQHGHHTPCPPPSGPLPTRLPESLIPIETRFPPAPGR